MGSPGQAPATTGVTVYVTFPKFVELLTKICCILTPGFTEFEPPVVLGPLTAVHVNKVPGVFELKAMFTAVLLQMVSLLTKLAKAVGTGFTVMV
jgi:hypothetical protein